MRLVLTLIKLYMLYPILVNTHHTEVTNSAGGLGSAAVLGIQASLIISIIYTHRPAARQTVQEVLNVPKTKFGLCRSLSTRADPFSTVASDVKHKDG